MARLIPVPWLRWQRFRVSGVVLEEGSRRPLPGLRVQAFDKDVFSDDFLGDCSTDEHGRFVIRFTDVEFKDALESQPDLYLAVFVPGRREPVHDTSHEIRWDASDDEHYEISIPASNLPKASA
jgi:hypothetical protein